MVVAFPTFEELLKKVKQPDLPDLKPPQTEFDSEGASQFGYKLPSGWKLNRQDGHGDTLLSPRGFKIRDFKTGPDGRITDFKMFDANDNPVDIPQPDFVAEEQAGLTALAGTPKTLPGQNTIMKPPPPPQLPPTEPPVNPIERDIEGPGIDIGLQPNEELFFDPQEGRMVRRIKPPPPLSPFQKVAQAAQASQDVVKGLGQLGLQAAKGAQDVFAPARALLTGRYPTREEQEQAGRVLAASGQTGQDIAKSLVTFKPGETGLPPEVEAGMLLPGTGLTMGVGRAARLAATTARNVVPGAVARGLEVTKPILAEERGGIRLPRKLTSVWEDVTVRDKNWMKGQAKERAKEFALKDAEALKAKEAAKPLPGQAPLEAVAKPLQEVTAPRPEGIPYGPSVQGGFGIGEKPRNVEMLGEFKGEGQKPGLVDKEALLAKEQNKPLPGQLSLEQEVKQGSLSGRNIEVPVNEIKVDPSRFQFKGNVNLETGTTGKLKEAIWNPDLGGILYGWEDKNGAIWVINGHHRLELAKRSGAKNVRMILDSEKAGVTESMARAKGALINIAEDQGTPLDVAKWLRDTGQDITVLKQHGISPKGRLASQGSAISNLDDSVFQKVATGQLDEDRAAIIGRDLANDKANQRTVANIVLESKRDISTRELEALIKEAKAAGVTKTTQQTLFGETEIERSNLLARAELRAWIESELQKDKRLFGYVTSQGRPQALAKGGTQVDVTKGQKLVQESATAQAIFEAKANAVGPINDIMAEATNQIVAGGGQNVIKAQTLDAIRKTIASGESSSTARLGNVRPSQQTEKVTPPIPQGEVATPPPVAKPAEAVAPGVVGQAAPLPPSGKLADLIPEGRDNMTLRQAYQSAKAKGMVQTEAEFKTLLDSEIQAGTIGGGRGTSSKSPLNSRLGSGNITGYIERPKPEPIPPAKAAPGEAARTPSVGPVPPVKQATTRMKTIQAKGLNAPESVTPQEAKQAHIEMGSPDGPQPPKPPTRGRKRPPPDEPANILRQIAEKATRGERADQTLLRLHEGAITAETGRVGVIVRDGNAKLKASGIGVYRRGQLVPRSNDIPQLDELYNALHNPSKVASGELRIPVGYEAIYKELRELTDWESVARLDFDPNMATVQDYFYRGWKPPEGMFANVAQGRPIVKTPAFKKPRVDATYQEMREAGFEPLFWNPYQQWGLSRMQGVKYREQMELVDKLKGMGDELIRPHAGGPIPQGWRVPEVGPAFEGKPFATTNPVTGEPMTMFTRRWITPDAVANMMENIYGKPPSVGKLIVGGKAFNPLAVIDWLTFIPKRAKLFGSFFQQIDFLNRNGAGAWSMLVDSLQAGKPVQGVMALARYPVNAVNILRANFSPAYRQSLARQLNSTTPLIKGRPGVNLKGISEAGLSTIDPTMLQWDQMDKVVQAVARETGVFKRLSSLVGDIESSMRRGLFSGVYPAAMITDIKRYTAPMVARMYPKLNDAQLNGQIARIINKKYSTIPASQSVIQNQVLRETLRRVFFSMGETEGLLRQATGAIRGPEAAYWRKNYIGTYLFLIATASTIHFASTGKPLPKERFVPVSKDNWGPLPFSYNTKFASPTIPLKGREGAEVTLDVVGQMDTALRILDPGSFITARESTPIRALVNQISGTNFGGVSIDDVGPGGVLSRTAQLAQDLFAPIGAGPLAAEAIRENIPGAKELVAPQEARLGRTGLGVQATGINVRAANINDFIVDMAKIKGLPEREGQTPWDGTFEGLNPKEVAKLRRLPEAKAYAEALGETPANIERRVDERDFKAQEERSSWLGEWTGTGWSNGQRPDPANPGKMLPYTINQWKDDLSKLYTKKAIEAATRERIQGEFKRRKPKDEKEKARWGYYEIADKYTEKDKKGKPIPGGKIQDIEGFMQEQDEYLAGLSPELEKHVIDNLGVGDDPKATQFRNDKREIRKSYWKPLKDIEDPRSEDKLNEAQTLRIKGKIKEAESIEKVHHLAGYTMFKNDREDLLRRQNPQLDELLVKWGYGGSFKNPLNIDRQLGLDYPDKQELTKLYSAYYALPSTSYLALSQAQVDAGRLPEKYKAEWELYRKLKTDTAKGLFRKAHKEASNSDLQEEFRRSHPDFDEWLQQAKGLNPLKAEKAKKAPRIRSSVSLGSAGMRGFGGGVSKTSARKYPRFKKARVSRAMTIRAPR